MPRKENMDCWWMGQRPTKAQMKELKGQRGREGHRKCTAKTPNSENTRDHGMFWELQGIHYHQKLESEKEIKKSSK